jgi:hypothetical protein
MKRVLMIAGVLLAIATSDIDCSYVETDIDPVILVEFGEIWIQNITIS